MPRGRQEHGRNDEAGCGTDLFPGTAVAFRSLTLVFVAFLFVLVVKVLLIFECFDVVVSAFLFLVLRALVGTLVLATAGLPTPASVLICVAFDHWRVRQSGRKPRNRHPHNHVLPGTWDGRR